MKHVIIGNSTAAVGAVEGIRQRDSESPIIVLSAETQHTYARPLISYLLSGKVDEERMAYRPVDFYTKHGVDFRPGQKAVEINTTTKTVSLESGESISYDTLLVATGSKSTTPIIPGIDKNNVFPFYTMEDAEQIRDYVNDGMKAIVLGAGLTAIKAAEALVSLGVETTLVVRSRILRKFLDARAGEILTNHLQKSGLRLSMGCESSEIRGEDSATAVLLKDGSELPCDLVISAIGIAPNIDVVQGSAIDVDQGVLVDERMRTNVPDVYAAGDVAQGYDLLAGCRRVIPLLPVAYAQGETAGRNMAGDDAVYVGMGMNAVSFFGLPVISAGLINEEATDQVHLETNATGKYYRKLIFRHNRLIGFVLVEEIDRAGILTWLIREQIDVTPFKESLYDGTFNHAHLPERIRREKLLATM